MKKDDCAIKEVNGFTRLDEGDRWKEENLLARYRDLLPEQEMDDDRIVLEASPYYLSGMVDAFEDLTRFVRYIPDIKAIALVRNPIDRAFSDYMMLTEGPFRGKLKGCAHGHDMCAQIPLPCRAGMAPPASAETASGAPDFVKALRCARVRHVSGLGVTVFRETQSTPRGLNSYTPYPHLPSPSSPSFL